MSSESHASRFASALAAFLILPGMIAFVVPLLWIRPEGSPFLWRGAPVVAIGAALLFWCIRDFYVTGKGTLAPWAPPKRLVIVGLYRFSRNPMYLAVLTILLGWTLAFDSRSLALYTVVVAILFHFRVIINEEPFLARTHGDEWIAYRGAVRRWL